MRIEIVIGAKGEQTTISVDGVRRMTYLEWAEGWRARSNAARNLGHVLDMLHVADINAERVKGESE